MELAALLSGPHDASDAIATINAGAGGTESQDWAEMLLRMYTRWAERDGFDAEVDDIQHGEEAGIKSATFTVKGTNVYGQSSAERGVHRLVRISPFDAQKRRHTSFASLDVIPMLEAADEEDIEIPPEDLRIDVYRSSGPGGQSVNTTDSAVRITHLPTGTVAACQNERSQLQNRAVAMRILKARLAEMERQKREDEMDSIRGERKAVDFGSQIRSYVLAPYQMVKDHRTDEEMGDPQRVLDGDIDRFIEAELRRRASEGHGVVGTRSRLVLASFLMLFAELALIRWVSAFQIYVAYFTNFILLASFLGIGVGFLRARSSRFGFRWAPVSFAAFTGLVFFIRVVRGLGQERNLETIFGLPAPPTWVVLPVLFLGATFVMACVAQGVAQLFERFEPLEAYRLDIAGSLFGIVAFSALSFLGAGPLVWGLVLGVCFVLLVPSEGYCGLVAGGRRRRGGALARFPRPVGRLVPVLPGHGVPRAGARADPDPRELTAAPVDAAVGGHPGGLLLQAVRAPAWLAGLVLVVGAGNGNDVALALAEGATHVDAVEIDQRLQEAGSELHPARPYQDPRVTPHIDDGRAYLERNDDRYDLILFALPDSLTLVSGQGSLRLESYLFTR